MLKHFGPKKYLGTHNTKFGQQIGPFETIAKVQRIYVKYKYCTPLPFLDIN